MHPAVFSDHAFQVTYFDRRGMPLFTDEVYADEFTEACMLAEEAGPSGIEFDITDEEDTTKQGRRNSHVPTRRLAAQALRKKALQPNQPKLWGRPTHKRQRPTRQYEELVATKLPPRLIFACFKAEEEGIEAFCVFDRPSFVVVEDLTISEILVTAHENIPDLERGYLAGIDPSTGKVMMKLAIE